jgi:hypothetical protein
MKPDPKDVMLAILSASAALAGLVLVFSGFLVSQYMALNPETTEQKRINKLRRFAKCGVLPFVCSIVSGVFSFMWLIHPGQTYYDYAIYTFETLGVVTAIYGIFAFLRLI